MSHADVLQLSLTQKNQEEAHLLEDILLRDKTVEGVTVDGGPHMTDMMEEILLFGGIVQGGLPIQEGLQKQNMVGEGHLVKETVEEGLPCIAQGDLLMQDTIQIETTDKDLQKLETVQEDQDLILALDKELHSAGEDLLIQETVQEDLQNMI